MFSFHGNQATIRAQDHEVQSVVNNFKSWLPLATRTLKAILETTARNEETERKKTVGATTDS
jgi:hypothetical protein